MVPYSRVRKSGAKLLVSIQPTKAGFTKFITVAVLGIFEWGGGGLSSRVRNGILSRAQARV